MKIALIGKQQNINPLIQQVKENDYFKLLGSYDTVNRSLKVSQSSIISPFGLINNAGCVLFQKSDEKSFNLLQETVKSSKPVLILNPHDLSIDEVNELLKITEEAESEIYVWSKYKLNTILSSLSKEFSECRFIEVDLEMLNQKDKESDTSCLYTEMVYVIDFVIGLVNTNIRKTNAFVISFESKDRIGLTIEFDNGKIANLRFSTLLEKKYYCIKGYSDSKIIEAFPNESKATITYLGLKNKIENKESKPNDSEKILLDEFSNIIQSEHGQFTTLLDFQFTQKIIKMIHEKKEML